jgi:site-specific DNA-cytosine methylase
MRVGSSFSGVGGLDLGLQRAGHGVAFQVESDPYRRAVLASHWPDVPRYDDMRTFDGRPWRGRIDLLCRRLPVQRPIRRWKARRTSPANKAGCSTTSPALQMTLLAKADSFFSKTSRVFSPRTVGEISPSFSGRWPNSGFTTRLGECWIAVTSESHNDGAACSSLRDVVAANVAPRFFLNPKAAAGILRRATKRRRKIPMALRTALSEIAIGSKTSETEPSQATPVEATESRWSLRRLTPTECERLQGMPDGWTKRLERTGTDIQRRATP